MSCPHGYGCATNALCHYWCRRYAAKAWWARALYWAEYLWEELVDAWMEPMHVFWEDIYRPPPFVPPQDCRE